MLILCLELIKSRLGVMSIQIRELFFIIIKTLIEKSPVGHPYVMEDLRECLEVYSCTEDQHTLEKSALQLNSDM